LDLIFLDPPFEGTLFAPALQAAAQAVAPGGWIYLEAPVLWTDEQLLPWYLSVKRYLKAGAVHAHLLQKKA
jgi:16S rRNA G966 N2-methylase RsmD